MLTHNKIHLHLTKLPSKITCPCFLKQKMYNILRLTLNILSDSQFYIILKTSQQMAWSVHCTHGVVQSIQLAYWSVLLLK